MPFPYVGQILLYALSQSDADLITGRRTSSDSIRNRMKRNPPEWPEGAQAHVGDPVTVGELVPLVLTRVDADAGLVGGQAMLNGSDTFWVAAAQLVTDERPAPGQAISVADQIGVEAAEGASRKPKARQ